MIRITKDDRFDYVEACVVVIDLFRPRTWDLSLVMATIYYPAGNIIDLTRT